MHRFMLYAPRQCAGDSNARNRTSPSFNLDGLRLAVIAVMRLEESRAKFEAASVTTGAEPLTARCLSLLDFGCLDTRVSILHKQSQWPLFLIPIVGQVLHRQRPVGIVGAVESNNSISPIRSHLSPPPHASVLSHSHREAGASSHTPDADTA
mmetsp:Transcript_4726/g.14276  ORF Transcript_4726/g.14276 Transcript_4726/m.14276 type:complete len:152 (+) Transcript_4726:143-598(+)